MRNRIFVLAMAILAVVLVSAVPASAQWGDPYWSQIDNVRRSMTDVPTGMMADAICRNHAGTGDSVEASWCYGQKYGPDGRFEGLNPQAVVYNPYARRGRYPMPYGGGYGYGYGMDPYYQGYGQMGGTGTTLGMILGGVAGGTLLRHKSPGAQAAGVLGGAIIGGIVGNKIDERNNRRRMERMQQAEARTYYEEPPALPKHVAGGQETVINRTGCNAKVNGQIVPPNGMVQADPSTARVSVQSKNCTPAYQFIRQGSFALVCK